jgi:hypothetical protein
MTAITYSSTSSKFSSNPDAVTTSKFSSTVNGYLIDKLFILLLQFSLPKAKLHTG